MILNSNAEVLHCVYSVGRLESAWPALERHLRDSTLILDLALLILVVPGCSMVTIAQRLKDQVEGFGDLERASRFDQIRL